ncbi:Serine/threonine-protein phosphatase 2A activator 2 [Entomophthora muscae]|uniref:Serine/threonine-protein phosphatase 2A activator 2 n=2 Tax=Entomophthora muscae TaxID=34485 RepID=A0ACC2RV17_9FUNG|nr:Serine/threonine-protein phosphatase 2A activator 2 [Entomophthora muscae]
MKRITCAFCNHNYSFLLLIPKRLCLKTLSLFTPDDLPAIVLRVFFDYIDLMRKIQSAYWLEPAGSHGVWGLDDYHFLPFLFGSAQLKGHEHFSPKCIHDSEVVDEFSKDYMYLACIRFVNTVKPSASLRWHSPMLDDISSVKTWDKVNEGMIKMYKAEVLGKLPIMQHFFLGSIISFDTGHSVPEDNCCGESDSDKPNEHAHVYAFGQEAPTCCGMRIPSAIGAAAFDKANTKKPDLPRPTRIPFD